MKLRRHIPAYFWHELCGIAIPMGWDMIQDVTDFLLEDTTINKSEEVLYILKNTEKTKLTLEDVIVIVRDKTLTKSALEFFVELNKMLREREVDELSAVFVSMHSGSSDYFLASMVYDLMGHDYKI